jgi:hypothetical protein
VPEATNSSISDLLARLGAIRDAATKGEAAQDRLLELIKELRAVESHVQDQIALQKAVSREIDPRRNPLIRPEDRPELHLERTLEVVQASISEAMEISQNLPKNRQKS